MEENKMKLTNKEKQLVKEYAKKLVNRQEINEDDGSFKFTPSAPRRSRTNKKHNKSNELMQIFDLLMSVLEKEGSNKVMYKLEYEFYNTTSELDSYKLLFNYAVPFLEDIL